MVFKRHKPKHARKSGTAGSSRFTLRRLFGIVLIVLGLGVLGYIPYTWVSGQLEQRSLRGQFEEQSASAMALNQAVLDNLQGAADTEKLRQLAAAYKDQITNHQAIADLEIPRMGKNLIVVEGDDEEALKMGTFHMPQTGLPGAGGNFVVGGDRVLYGAPFLYLNELNNGDQINVRTQYGTFNYTVINKQIVNPEDNTFVRQQLDANGQPIETIALFTCDPPWGTTNRLFVLGQLTGAAVRNSSATTAASAAPAG